MVLMYQVKTDYRRTNSSFPYDLVLRFHLAVTDTPNPNFKMFPNIILLRMVIFSVLTTCIRGYKPCIVSNKTNVDEPWFIKAATGGFHVVEHSDCDNCEKKEAWAWLRPAGRTIPKQLCWSMHVNTANGGKYTLPFNCKYYDIAKADCELDFSHSDIKDKIKWGGNFVVTQTDNSTYAAGTMCIFGKENFWWIITTNPDKSLPTGVLKTIHEDYEKQGFQSGNIAVEGKSPLFMTKLNAHPEFC